MDSQSTILIFVLLFLILLSAFFSAAETAFSSLNRARLKNMAGLGNKKAKLSLKLVDNHDELLSTILIGNNIVNISSASLATVLFVRFFGDIGATISTIVMTLVVLTFGEISPKTMAKENPEGFAMFSSSILRMLTKLFKPLNFLFAKLKVLLNKIFKQSTDRSLTDSELLTIVEEVEQDGGIDADESELIRNVIEFDDIEAIDILTPRVDVVAVSKEATNNEVAQIFKETGYSRLPVFDETIDSIVGVILEKNFYSYCWGTENDIDTILKPAEFIPPSMKISTLLKLLQKNKLHMAVVVDEFGGTEGILTLEDVIEELVGEIWDEHDEIAAESFIKTGDDIYHVYSSADLDDMFEFFHISPETDVSTINGWVTEMLDKIPSDGDSFEYAGLVFSVTATENNCATEITVKGEPLSEENDDEELDK